MRNVKYVFWFVPLVLIACLGLLILFYMIERYEPTSQGHTAAQWLNIVRSSTNSTSNPLQVVKIFNNYRTGTVEFEVPIVYDLLDKYDLLTNNAELHLISNGRVLSAYSERATDGNCILGCNANDFSPGTNQVRVDFFLSKPSDVDRPLFVTGPITEYVSGNVCSVNDHITFDYSSKQAILWADLSIQTAKYSIELLDTNGNQIKTISGITTNGVINERWNLIGDNGKQYPFGAFSALYRIRLRNSLP